MEGFQRVIRNPRSIRSISSSGGEIWLAELSCENYYYAPILLHINPTTNVIESVLVDVPSNWVRRWSNPFTPSVLYKGYRSLFSPSSFWISVTSWSTSTHPRYLPALSRTAKYRVWIFLPFASTQNSAESLLPLLKSSRIWFIRCMLFWGWHYCTL